MTHTSICPVCDMTATDSPIMAEHLGIRYRFCSEQCRANFIARPRLYVGMSVEKEGRKESIKCRKFRLDRDLSSSQTEEIGRALAQLMGVRETKVRKRSIAITYDLLQCRAEQIEACLFAAGIKLGGGGATVCAWAGFTTRKRTSWTIWMRPPRPAAAGHRPKVRRIP